MEINKIYDNEESENYRLVASQILEPSEMTLTVVIGTLEQFIKQLMEDGFEYEANAVIDENTSTRDAVVLYIPDANIQFLWLQTNASIENIVHEVLHIVVNLCSHLEIKINTKSSEFAAYYIGKLSNSIFNITQKINETNE